MDNKKDTLYFLCKLDVGGASVMQAREYAANFQALVNSKQSPDDQYHEKWYILPVKDEGTSITLLHPQTEDAKRELDIKLGEFGTRESKPLMSRLELTRRYLAMSNKISDDLEDKSQFGPEEICAIIHGILEEDQNYTDASLFPVIYFGVENNNGRIYEQSEVEKHLDEMNADCANGKFLGQINYPINPVTNTLEPVALVNVSHKVEEFIIRHGILWARIMCLDTKQGELLNNLMDNNLVVFRPVIEGSVDGKYAKIDKFIGVHAVDVMQDSYNIINSDN